MTSAELQSRLQEEVTREERVRLRADETLSISRFDRCVMLEMLELCGCEVRQTDEDDAHSL